MYIVIVCIVFLALTDFGGRRFISTVLLLLLLLLRSRVSSWLIANVQPADAGHLEETMLNTE